MQCFDKANVYTSVIIVFAPAAHKFCTLRRVYGPRSESFDSSRTTVTRSSYFFFCFAGVHRPPKFHRDRSPRMSVKSTPRP